LAYSSGHVVGAVAIQEGNDKVVQVGMYMRSVTGASVDAVLAHGHIAAMAQSALSAPVLSNEPEQTLRGSVRSRQAGSPKAHRQSHFTSSQVSYARFSLETCGKRRFEKH
jgi:hypothetical protein